MRKDHDPQPSSFGTEDLLSTGHTQLRDLIHLSMSGEFATSGNNRPVAYPLTPFYDEESETICVTSPIAYAGKARAIEQDPCVGLLLHDDHGEFLVTGTARVHDDIERNTEWVRRLNEGEPPAPKRDANLEKYEFIDSRIGNALIGWMGKRIVIEVTPESMYHIAGPTSLHGVEAWESVGMDQDEAGAYTRAILTVVDNSGYPHLHPLSHVRFEGDQCILDINADLEAGQPACLLFHWHDDASIYLGQRIIRGRIRKRQGQTIFSPGSSTTLRNDNLRDTIRFILQGKKRTRTYLRERTNPPGPRRLPIVGNTLQFMRDPPRFYRELPTYGDVVKYRIAWHTWVAVLHPEEVERILVEESHRYRRYNFEELGFDLPAEGLFFTDGEQWRQQRRHIQPVFAPRKIADFTDTIVSESIQTVDAWEDGSTIDPIHEFSELVLEILTTTIFDLDLDERRDVVTNAGRALSDRADTRNVTAFLPSWVPTPRNRRFNHRMAEFDTLVETLINERQSSSEDREDLLSTLLAMTEGSATSTDNEYEFSVEELRDQLVTFLFAGHETTALVLAYSQFLLSQHEDVREALLRELDSVCGDRPPTYADIEQLEFTQQVINEVMRFYPPVYVLFREAREDLTIGGFSVPTGTKIAIPQLLLHRDDRWWDSPSEFRPERWTPEGAETMENYAYFPFGGGPRHCVGMRLANVILLLGVATITQRVEFDLLSEPDPEMVLSATQTPVNPINLRVRHRSRAF